MSLRIEVDEEGIARLCRHYGVRRLSFFGSVVRDDFGPDSDVDVLVEFESDANAGLFEFVDLQKDLSELVGRVVDLHTPASLSHFFRDKIVSSAEVAYAA